MGRHFRGTLEIGELWKGMIGDWSHNPRLQLVLISLPIAAAARWLGCRYRERHEHGHYRTRNATFLSPAGRANLRTAFRREYEVLAALEAGPGRVALA